uniref:50S ribosomal protein L35 n=1 Tax=Bursaphelenchus xylophilus TaxID=6326 RepID=A0A1I7SNE8_BURXY
MSLEKKTFERQRRFLVSARVGRTWKNSKFLERQRTYLNLGSNKGNRVLRSKVANARTFPSMEHVNVKLHAVRKNL